MHKTFEGLRGVLEISVDAVLSDALRQGQTQLPQLSVLTDPAQLRTNFSRGLLQASDFEDITWLCPNLEGGGVCVCV